MGTECLCRREWESRSLPAPDTHYETVLRLGTHNFTCREGYGCFCGAVPVVFGIFTFLESLTNVSSGRVAEVRPQTLLL